MMIKSQEAKNRINQNKIKLQKILSMNVPIVPVTKLPSLMIMAKEYKNMEILSTTGKKNMQEIDKAMAYYQSRMKSTPPDLYAKYTKEGKELKDSIGSMVATIDSSTENVKKSYILLHRLNAEIPKAEALRHVAQEMVSKGL